jgi:hypothetical protein
MTEVRFDHGFAQDAPAIQVGSWRGPSRCSLDRLAFGLLFTRKIGATVLHAPERYRIVTISARKFATPVKNPGWRRPARDAARAKCCQGSRLGLPETGQEYKRCILRTKTLREFTRRGA